MSTERHSKRLRGSVSRKPDDGRNCYLDTVPEDSLRIVLRCLSNRPQHKNWRASISPTSVKNVLDVGGALTRTAASEFHSIGGQDGIPLEATSDASILRRIVHQLPLRRLVFVLGGGKVFCNFLRGCGAELEELVLDTEWSAVAEADILAISTHCTKLSSLAIHGHQVGSPLTPIWRSLGPALTRIYIGCYDSAPGYGMRDIISVPDLVQHCVNLRHVDVDELQNTTAEVLLALSSRIRVLSIEDSFNFHSEPWDELFRAFTNLEALHLSLEANHFRLDCHAKVIDLLSLMRTKLVSLKLHGLHAIGLLDNPDELLPAEDRLGSVLSTCSALKKVEFVVSSVFLALIRKLLESLKSVTTMVCDMSLFQANPYKDVIDVISSHSRNLESLTIWTNEPLKSEDVNALVGLPRLNCVTLRHRFCRRWKGGPLERRALGVVKSFEDCAQLRQLEITDFAIMNQYRPGNRSHRIADAAMKYGRKDFDMFIGGVQYRTW